MSKPTILQERFTRKNTEQKTISERVAQADLSATDTEREAVQRIAQGISAQFKDEVAESGMTDAVRERIKVAIEESAASNADDFEQQQRIEKIAVATIIGLGPLDAYMADPTVTEIIVQRYDNICVERNGVIQHVDATFNDEEQLRTVIERIVQPVGRQINVSSPMVDARLRDGSRVNATIPPASPDGATLSIRKFSDAVITPEQYLELESLSEDMLKFLAICVRCKISMIVSGGTSSGKTSLLNMLSSFIPKEELIVTIEDSCELQLKQPNVRRMEARLNSAPGMMKVDTQALVKNSLRMRPDRIIVGEIRDGSITDMMAAMSTGHEGSMSTVHANNPGNLINSRFPILYSMNDATHFTQEAQNIQIAEALQLIVHIARLPDGRRKITHITHVCGINEKYHVKISDIFKYDAVKDEFYATGYVPESIVERIRWIEPDCDLSFLEEGGEQ